MMHIRIFQIDHERDKDRVKFENHENTLRYAGSVCPAIYNEVYSGEVDCDNMEELFDLFNRNQPLTYRGHSLSVSDICEVADSGSVEDGFYFCDSIGYMQIDFDVSKTHMPDNLLRVVMVEPNKAPYVAEVENKLEALQQAVGGGLIEITYPYFDEDGTMIVSNEESKLIGMEGNRKIYGELYAGPFFIVLDDGRGEMVSLNEGLIKKYTDQFKNPEHYTEEDVEESIHFEMQFY